MTQKNIVLITILILIAGAIFYLQSEKVDMSPDDVVRQELVLNGDSCENGSCASRTIPANATSSSSALNSVLPDRQAILKQKATRYYPSVEIVDPKGFINTGNINLASLVGKKVILIDFWTFSCINCIRTIPYLNAWYSKYKDKGFVIIGLHAPEFSFERDYENVVEHVRKYGIEYPVVLDNNFATWNAYGNNSWPSKYLIDIDGFVIHHTIGERRYAETEQEIQRALKERAEALGENTEIPSDIAKPAVQNVDYGKIGSPEIYFGSARNEFLGNGSPQGTQTLVYPSEVKLNKLYLSGTWKFDAQFTENESADAKIVFRYRAKSFYIVGSAENPVSLTILRDGKPVDAEAGEDVHSGKVIVQEDRLYKLIDDPVGYGEHTLEIIIDKPGFKAFTFTFG